MTQNNLYIIGVISDTHGVLEDRFLNFFNDCNEIWHAGDIGSLEVLEKLQNFKPLKAVFGNIDDLKIRSQLKEFLVCELFNKIFLIKHNVGKFSYYDSKTKELIFLHKPNYIICGHTHILAVKQDKKNNLIYINPGAAGNFGPHIKKTVLKLVFENYELKDILLFEVDK